MALIPVAEALERILAHAQPLPAERVPVAETAGRVLAENVVALRTQPPADVSAMDGYAVRAADIARVPATLRLIGEIAAGRPVPLTVNAGEAVRIFTGGVVPQGADTIAVQEHAERHGDDVVVSRSAPAGKHIRRAGLDFKQGDILLARGRLLTGRDVALAASANHPALAVHRQVRMAFFATGDELVAPGTEPGAGQIVYSNGYAVMALARSEGAAIVDLGIVPDRVDRTVAMVRRAREIDADVLVTTGGASVGDYDLVHPALESEGVALSFWKVALRPGRPLMSGRLGPMHVLGLPGNPVSAYVCSFLFLTPLLRRLAGRGDDRLLASAAVLGCDLPANDERADYMRASLSAGEGPVPVATPFTAQDSSMLRVLARADCLLLREAHAPAARAGEPCRILKLPL